MYSTNVESWILKFMSSPKRPRTVLGNKAQRGFYRISRGLRNIPTTESWHCHNLLVQFYCLMKCLMVGEDKLSFTITVNGHKLKQRHSEGTLMKRLSFFRQVN